MELKKTISILIIFIFFSAGFIFLNPSYTAFAVYEPDSELNLEKEVYSPNKYLDGTLDLTFDGIVEDVKIIVELDSQKDEKTISEILTELNYFYEIDRTGGMDLENNEDGKKTLTYEKEDTKKIVFEIQKDATLNSLSFNIEGLKNGNSFPTFVTIDVLDDQESDLIYLGDTTGWDDTDLLSDGLDLNGGNKISLEKEHYYCELIDLPYSDKFKISAKYTGTTELKAIILPTTIGDKVKASYSPNNCTLQKQGDLGDCELSLDKALQGKNLVCVYPTSTGINLYLEQKNQVKGYYGYICDKDFIEQSPDLKQICTQKTEGALIGDFFILANAATYSGLLDKKISFAENLIQENLLDSINYYLADCEESPCGIPISITSDSKGIIEITDFKAVYGPIETTTIWDLIETLSTIYEIDGEEPSGLSIPLSIFNITIPRIQTDYETLTLKITIASETIEKEIEVYSLPSVDLSDLINTAKTSLKSFSEEKKQIAKILGIDSTSTLQQLENYETQIQYIESSNLTQSEKETQLEDLRSTINLLVEELPEDIKIKKKITNIPIQKPTQIPDDYLLETQRTSVSKEQIIQEQDKLSIKADIIYFKLIFPDKEEEKTLITKTFTGYLTDFYIIEEIPKSIVASVDEIKFETTNFEIIKQDPIIRWYMPSEISYILPGDITENFNEIFTVAIPKTISYEPLEEYKHIVCGDGTCTTPLEDEVTCPEDCVKRINWYFVIVLLAILIGGLYYLYFYKGKFSFKKVTTKKSLFKSKSDEINLRNYIKKSLNQKIPRERVKKILIAKGWTEEQIGYSFKHL